MIEHTISSGVKVLFEKSKACDLVTIQCWFGVGSLHEKKHQIGMAHFLEHMMFKGTERRGVGRIAGDIEDVGGQVNAYTTFDRTVYYATVASEHYRIGMDVLSDAVFASVLDAKEIESEKEVVCEEIRRSLDNPASQVGRKIFKHVFAGTEASRPILGSEETVKAFTRDQIFGFYKAWYTPTNMTLVASGRVDPLVFLEAAEKYFGKDAVGNQIASDAINPVRNWPASGACEVFSADYQQPRLEICFPAPSAEQTDAALLDVAAFALGAGDSSRLNRVLRDQMGLVSAIGASVYTPTFGGMFSVSAYPILECYEKAVYEIGRLIGELKYRRGITADEIRQAVENLKADHAYQDETLEGKAKALGSGIATPFGPYYEDLYWGVIRRAEPYSVDESVRKWLEEDKAVIIGMTPVGHELASEAVKKAFLDGVAEAKKSVGAAIAPVKEQTTSIAKQKLKSGRHLVSRCLQESKFVNLFLACHGGLRAEDKKTAGLHHIAADLLGRASKSYTYEQVLNLIEGTGASIDGFSGKDSFGWRVHCLAEQWEEVLDVFQSLLLEPKIPEQQYQVALAEIKQQIKAQQDSSANIAFRELQQALYGDHPYRFPQFGTEDSVAGFSLDGVQAHIENISANRQWVVSAVTPFGDEPIRVKLETALAGWASAEKAASFPSDQLAGFSPTSETIHIPKEREQTHIAIGTRGITWSSSHRAALDAMAAILGGQSGRLFMRLRDTKSLAYTVSPVISHGHHPGLFAFYIATANEKVTQAIDALNTEIEELVTTPPSQEELTRAVNMLLSQHEEGLQRGSSQALTMGLMELYGLGAEDFLEYPQKLKSLTPKDLLNACQQTIGTGARVSVVVGQSPQ